MSRPDRNRQSSPRIEATNELFRVRNDFSTCRRTRSRGGFRRQWTVGYPTNRYVSRHARTRPADKGEGDAKTSRGVSFRGPGAMGGTSQTRGTGGREGCRRTRSRGSALGALARLRRRQGSRSAKPGHRPPTHLAGFAQRRTPFRHPLLFCRLLPSGRESPSPSQHRNDNPVSTLPGRPKPRVPSFRLRCRCRYSRFVTTRPLLYVYINLYRHTSNANRQNAYAPRGTSSRRRPVW